ncbi:Dps family protein [Vibrio owensii]|uniref:Dps family protein n=1 Tax=Vibrio owensii TaxID=696485 RepID=UPI0018F1DD12|nr:Dps family protein [Vibrio owensii]
MIEQDQRILIGLKKADATLLGHHLNVLLATYSVFYTNLRGYHWNIQGQEFFDLHGKFEELYEDIAGKIDEIAERVCTLESQPVHSLSQYVYLSAINEHTGVKDGIEAATGLLSGLVALVELQRPLLKWAQDLGDEGTSSILSDYIREQEKLIWQYQAYLA